MRQCSERKGRDDQQGRHYNNSLRPGYLSDCSHQQGCQWATLSRRSWFALSGLHAVSAKVVSPEAGALRSPAHESLLRPAQERRVAARAWGRQERVGELPREECAQPHYFDLLENATTARREWPNTGRTTQVDIALFGDAEEEADESDGLAVSSPECGRPVRAGTAALMVNDDNYFSRS